jgi:hypothetical protein
VIIVGVHTRVGDVPYMEDFTGMELEVSFRDCLTGMWKAKMGDPPQLSSLYPGSIKSSLANVRASRTVESRVSFYPRISMIVRELLREGWAYPLSENDVLEGLGECMTMNEMTSTMGGSLAASELRGGALYRTALLQHEIVPSESTSRDSGSTWKDSGDGEPWRQALEEMRHNQEGLTARVQGLEGSLHQVEKETAKIAANVKETGEVIKELREDSRRLTALELQSSSTNSAVMRMEEMMMRMLMGGGMVPRRNKVEEIESEIATMRLTNQELRHTGMDRPQIEQIERNNV